MPEVPTREIFRNLSTFLQVLFYLIAAVSTFIFCHGFYRRIQKYRRGRPTPRFTGLWGRLGSAARAISSNATVWHRDAYAGLSHTLIFWGFVVLFMGTVVVFIDHDILRFFGAHLLAGRFYLGFSLVLDVFGVVFLVGLLMMMLRRDFWKLPQLDYRRADSHHGHCDRSGYRLDDQIFLGLLFVIGVTGFLLEGLRIASDRPSFEVWSPVGWALANLTDGAGLKARANDWHLYTWWLHAAVVMLFIAYIPYSKAMHMLTDMANLVFTDARAGRRLPRPEADSKPSGAQQGMG
ncbi:MAG: Fe-S oxidoreductase, partial [Acidobacteriota bacterium]